MPTVQLLSQESQTRDGERIVRERYRVDNLGGTDRTMLTRAEQASGIPVFGQQFPGIAGCYLRSRRATHYQNQKSLIQVDCEFSTQAPETASGGLSLSDPIEIDYSGIPIVEEVFTDERREYMFTRYHSYTYTAREAHSAEIERPGLEIRISQTTRRSPDYYNRTYGGRVNADRWGEYAPGQVLCKHFSGSTTSDSELFRVTGFFVPSPLTRGDWLFEARSREWLGNEAREVGQDLKVTFETPTFGNGVEVFDVYQRVPFAQSGFVLPNS